MITGAHAVTLAYSVLRHVGEIHVFLCLVVNDRNPHNRDVVESASLVI